MADPGPLVGRERELAALDGRLTATRLLSLTGPGGCGKTRVAMELAARAKARPIPMESAVIELAPVRGADQVVQAILRGLHARERGGRGLMDVLVQTVRGRNLLLVLDNCEHVVAEVRSLTTTLLEAAPSLRLLVTSRLPLGSAGEEVFRLPPLSVPEGEDVASVVRADAGRFFVERGATADPNFALTPSAARAVARICHDLDGLPLALALAAARVDRMSAREIADGLPGHNRLADVVPESALPQHRSIRASLDWSHQLLDEQEQALLRRLAIFAGGWTAAAARAVAMPEASETQVRGLLDVLDANGLIAVVPSIGPKRWSFLQTVAEYASERLARDPDAEELRDRHLAWFREYATEADSFLLDPRGHDRIEEEAPNLRLALQRALQHDASSALEIVASLTRHWILAEHFEEGGAAAAAALSVASVDADTAARAVVHCGAGLIATLSEDYPAAVANTMHGVALMAELDDVKTEARCLQMSGNVLILAGLDLQEGLRSTHRAVELLRGTGDVLGVAYGLVTVAMAEGLCDRFAAVRAAYDEFLTITSASHHVRLRTWAELAAAWAEVLVGSPERALRHADLAVALEGDWPSITHFVGISHRVHALARRGRAEEAVAAGLQALAEAQRSGVGMATPAIEMALAVAQLANLDLDAADTLARNLTQLPQMHTVALMRETLGRVALARGDGEEAATQARELSAVAQRTGSPRHRAIVDFIKGCAAVLDGDRDRGRDFLQEALARYWQLGLELGVADALDELALLAAGDGELGRSARLAAAAAAARARLDSVSLTPATKRLETVRLGSIDRDGAAAWDRAWSQGAELGLREAVAYARRSRGPHTRSRDGWNSLTPTELQVAQLAATGISNPQIASKLFMSRSTVKMHLSSVYMKLGIANRTELAGMAIRDEGAEGHLPDSAGQDESSAVAP